MLSHSFFRTLNKLLPSNIKDENVEVLEIPKNKAASKQAEIRDFVKRNQKTVLIGVK